MIRFDLLVCNLTKKRLDNKTIIEIAKYSIN